MFKCDPHRVYMSIAKSKRENKKVTALLQLPHPHKCFEQETRAFKFAVWSNVLQ